MIEIIGNPKLESKSSIKQIADDCIKRLNIDNKRIVEIIFVDRAKIQQLNFNHRKIDRPTDVLSFPQTKINSDKQILGSIVICEEIAEELGEIDGALVQHGLIHLLGYDHETDKHQWQEVENTLKH